ncbi:MAG: cytochrome c3 family protein [Thermodesulfobacteriota bacterium]
MQRKFVFILFVLGLLFLLTWPVYSQQEKEELCFETSLHHTTRGMATWYEAEDGFFAITDVPYEQLGCMESCHVASCNDCHLEEIDDKYAYTVSKAKKAETCLKCHAREKATIAMDKANDSLGVHMRAGMQCADCHSAREVHGDGTIYESMRAPGAMDTECENCHTMDAEDYPAVPQTQSHFIHGDRLDCTACHVQNSMTCYNCHFGVLKETDSKPQSMVGKAKDFLLLVKCQDKVCSGTIQSLVGTNDEPFVAYVPYFTHSVSKQGLKCEECHNSKALQAIMQGDSFSPVEYKDGQLSFYKGVIPAVPDRLDWIFLHKQDGSWAQFEPEQNPLQQMAVYAEPLGESELEGMALEQTYTPQ